MTSYPKFDELISNLEDSSNQLIDLIRVAETIKQLSNQQDNLLEGFANGNKQIGQAAANLKQAQKDAVSSISLGFNTVALQNEKLISSVLESVSEGIAIIQQEGRSYRGEHEKLLESAEETLLRFDKTQQTGLSDLKAETGKVSQLEKQVLALVKQSADQFRQNSIELNKAVDKVGNSSQAIVKLADAAKTTEAALAKNIQNELAELSRKNGIALTSIKLTVAEKIEKIEKELAEGRMQSESAGGDIFNIVTKNRDDNRQFYTDFERLLRIKLDENKAEIKQLIEHERNQVREIVNQRVELLDGQIKAHLEQSFGLLLKRQRTLQTTIWVMSGVLTALISSGLAKAFGFL